MPSLKHKFISTKADGNNTTEVRPTNWNDEHDLKTVGASVYLGQNATGGGDVRELPIVATSGDDFTMWTKAAIQAAITAAINNYHAFSTGDIIASLATSKSGGWARCNGQQLFLGNGESNHALFLLLWEINGRTWPVSPTRGTTAEADWLASKSINVPNMHGCVLGMVDGGANVNTLIAQFGVKVGTDKLFMTIPHMPQHDHGWVPREGNSTPSVSAGGVRGGDWEDPASPTLSKGKARSEPIGGDPDATPAFANPVPVNLTQPTVGVNYFIKL